MTYLSNVKYETFQTSKGYYTQIQLCPKEASNIISDSDFDYIEKWFQGSGYKIYFKTINKWSNLALAKFEYVHQ